MTAELAFFIGALPFALAAAFSDLRTMTIPNWICLALLGVFVVLGLIFLPLQTVGWRLLAGLIVLVLLFFVNAAGIMGGGDAKLLAAAAPYVAIADTAPALLILAVCMLVTLPLHRVARAMPFVRAATPGWKSWEAGRHFPMGISISLALVIYLFTKL